MPASGWAGGKGVIRSHARVRHLLLLGLGALALIALGDRYLMMTAARPGLWALAAIIVGIGLAWLADFNVWELWGLPVREDWIGVTLTGLMLSGFAHFWRDVLGLFSGLVRKYNDEAAVLEKSQDLRRAA